MASDEALSNTKEQDYETLTETNQYKIFNEEEENITTNGPQHSRQLSANLTKASTKYDYTGIIIILLTILFLIIWIIYIIYNFTQYGITTAYCKDPYSSCDVSYFHPGYNEICCNSHLDTNCYIPYDTGCSSTTNTISTFIAQLLLIILIIIQIYQLINSTRKGIEIRKPEEKEAKSKIKRCIQKAKSLKNQFDSKKINCRRCAYSKKDTPQKTAVNFLFNSITILSLLKLLQDAPTIILNIFTGTPALNIVGYVMLSTAIGNILQTLYGRYCCCCNPCRGRCCGNTDCCCDCCCFMSYNCCCKGHFPSHHRPYVEAVAQIINFSMHLKYGSAASQITAVGFIDSSTEWHLWLTCFNFVSGVLKMITLLQIYWRYYYLCCFYWSRITVNKYENYKIHELLNKLLKGAYIFEIKVENEDEFVRVDNNEQIANKVNIICDCFSICLIIQMGFMCTGIAFMLWSWTEKLNENFNISQDFFNF